MTTKTIDCPFFLINDKTKKVEFIFSKKFKSPKNYIELKQIINNCEKEKKECQQLVLDRNFLARDISFNLSMKAVGFDHKTVFFKMNKLPQNLESFQSY